MRGRWVAVGLGLSVGSLTGFPGLLALLGVLCLALPCWALWVVIVEGPDKATRDAAEWRGNWRQLLRQAETARAQNNIRRGPRG